MDVTEIQKISNRSKFEPFCISLEGIFESIRSEAYKGSYNCLISIPEEKVIEFTKDLENLGYNVFWEKVQDNYLLSKYPKYADKFILLDISWF